MNIQRFLAWPGPNEKVVVVERTQLSEGELKLAFQVPNDNRLWVGMMQLIDQLRDDAIKAARLHIGNTPVSASFTGGHEHLELLRDRMIAYRESAIRMSPQQVALVMAAREGP